MEISGQSVAISGRLVVHMELPFGIAGDLLSQAPAHPYAVPLHGWERCTDISQVRGDVNRLAGTLPPFPSRNRRTVMPQSCRGNAIPGRGPINNMHMNVHSHSYAQRPGYGSSSTSSTSSTGGSKFCHDCRRLHLRLRT